MEKSIKLIEEADWEPDFFVEWTPSWKESKSVVGRTPVEIGGAIELSILAIIKSASEVWIVRDQIIDLEIKSSYRWENSNATIQVSGGKSCKIRFRNTQTIERRVRAADHPNQKGRWCIDETKSGWIIK